MNGTLAAVRALLHSTGVRYALIGGHAIGARGFLRATLDVDLLTTDRQVLKNAFWETIGAKIDVRAGDVDDPLAGVVHIDAGRDSDIDIVVARYEWQQEVIDRAEPAVVFGELWPVPTAADLILLKLFAGGPQDANDIHSLLAVGPREELAAAVDAHIDRLPNDAKELWRRIRTSSATSG